MEEGKGERYLASGRQYGNALLQVRHQEEEEGKNNENEEGKKCNKMSFTKMCLRHLRRRRKFSKEAE